MNKKSKILVVDDSEANREMLAFFLEEFGFQTAHADNGESAVEMALEFDFDLIFMDIKMPVMDGDEATEVLRSINCTTPIIACSAESNKTVIERYLNNGFNSFIEKPIDDTAVDKILKQYLNEEKVTVDHLIVNNKSYQENLNRLKKRFLTKIPDTIQSIQLAINSQDKTNLKRIAHKLKGSAAQFGFDDITSLGRGIEKAFDDGKPSIIQEKIQLLIIRLKKIESQQTK